MKPRLIDTASKFLAGIQIKLTFLQILLEHHPRPVDFDLARERIALPDTLTWNLYGLAVRELQMARLIQEVGVTRLARPVAKGGKRSIWKLVDSKRAGEWVKAYQNILPVDPPGLFDQKGGVA